MKERKAFVVYAKYPDSPWFWKGRTGAVSSAQAINNVFHRLHGRTLRENVGQEFEAFELGSPQEIRRREQACSVPREYIIIPVVSRRPLVIAQSFLFDMGVQRS